MIRQGILYLTLYKVFLKYLTLPSTLLRKSIESYRINSKKCKRTFFKILLVKLNILETLKKKIKKIYKEIHNVEK